MQLGSPHRLKTIYRTNTSVAFNRGRYATMKGNTERRPLWMYDARNDSLTRDAHRAMDNRVYRHDDPIWSSIYPPNGFNCFSPGTKIQGKIELALKSRYSGPMIEIVTTKGYRLCVTPNHPILTEQGWLPANQITKGIDLVTDSEHIDRLAGVPAEKDYEHTPAAAEQIFESLRVDAFGFARMAAFNFHGDAQFGKGDIEISAINSDLLHETQAVASHLIEEFGLASVKELPARSLPCRATLPLNAAGLGSDTLPFEGLGLGTRTHVDAALFEKAGNGNPGDSERLRESLDALSVNISLDEVIGVREYDFVGHVFDFQTETGLLSADGIIAHNCRCIVRALTPDEVKQRGLRISNGGKLPAPKGFPDNGWKYNPATGSSLWDIKGSKLDIGLAGATAGATVGAARELPIPDGQNWRGMGRPSIKDVPVQFRHDVPVLAAAPTRAEALSQIVAAVGLKPGQGKLIRTPIGEVQLHEELLQYVAAKRQGTRERFANFILPTLRKPWEVWSVPYRDGARLRFVSVFTGDSDFFSIVIVNRDGSLIWNTIPVPKRSRYADNQRWGNLLYWNDRQGN